MDDDTLSQVSWGAASESDRMLFTVLSNTERLDVERLPRLNTSSAGSGGGSRIEEVLPTVREEEGEQTTTAAPVSAAYGAPAMTADTILRDMEHQPSHRLFRDEDYSASPPSLPTDPLLTEGNVEALLPDARGAERDDAARTRYDDAGGNAYDAGGESLTGREDLRPRQDDRDLSETRMERPRDEDEERRRRDEEGDVVPRTATTDPVRSGPEYDREQILEKQSTLYDLNQLEARGVRLSRRWTMDDSLDDMTHELRHHLLVLDERENVGMMKNGLKMALTGIEIINTRFNLLDLEGWSTQAASELDRQDGNLSRIYRKYWRRSTSNNPESEILFSLFSSMGMYHMKRSMARQMMNRNTRPPPTRARRRRATSAMAEDSSSDDERPPR